MTPRHPRPLTTLTTREAAPAMYPHHLAGDVAAAPTDPTPEQLAAARVDEDLAVLQLVDGELFAAPAWRVAGALEQLRAEANACNPNRDKRSDGTIGDAAHLARTSKHNPLRGVVRALDLDVDGLPIAAAFERLRQLAHAGRLPWLFCLILNGRITAPDFSGWRVYTGANQHITHGHADTVDDPARYDDRRPTGVFAPVPAPAGPGWTGPDLTGRNLTLRGDQGNNGPRVQDLQRQLNRRFPAYSKLADDGWWGDRTAAVLDEFGRRVGLPEADGRNIGPKLARALFEQGVRP